MLKSNTDKMALVPCENCGTFDDTDWDHDTDKWIGPANCDEDMHWVAMRPAHFTHFSIKGKWHVVPAKFVKPLLSLVEIDAALCINGAMAAPEPIRIERTLTSFFSFLRRQGISEEQMATQFPKEQVGRMKGRVFKKLVKGR